MVIVTAHLILVCFALECSLNEMLLLLVGLVGQLVRRMTEEEYIIRRRTIMQMRHKKGLCVLGRGILYTK